MLRQFPLDRHLPAIVPFAKPETAGFLVSRTVVSGPEGDLGTNLGNRS